MASGVGHWPSWDWLLMIPLLALFTLFNAGVGYRMQAAGHAVTWRGSVENLTNRRYWSNAGVGLPRTFAVSVRLDL